MTVPKLVSKARAILREVTAYIPTAGPLPRRTTGFYTDDSGTRRAGEFDVKPARTVNTFGRPVAESARRTHNAFGRPLPERPESTPTPAPRFTLTEAAPNTEAKVTEATRPEARHVMHLTETGTVLRHHAANAPRRNTKEK